MRTDPISDKPPTTSVEPPDVEKSAAELVNVLVTHVVDSSPHAQVWRACGWEFAIPLHEATRRGFQAVALAPSARLESAGSGSPASLHSTAGPLGEALWRRTASARFEPARRVDIELVGSILAASDAPRRSHRRSGRGCFAGIRLFVLSYLVEGLESGTYEVRGDGEVDLRLLSTHDTAKLRRLVREIVMGQPAPESAALTFVWVLETETQQAMIPHSSGLLAAYIDVGRLAQRLVLSAIARRLRTHQTPAVRDPLIEDLLGLESGVDHVLYTVTVG
jgi:hypothetical protein